MSLTIEQMEFLQARGLSLSDVIEFARLNAKPERSKGAERQARYRARNKADDVTCDVTGDVTGVTSAPLSRPPNENNSNPPTHTPVKQTPARKGHRLPVDWQPAALTGDTAEAIQTWPAGAIERELSRFRDWAASASGSNAIKSDWQAAWRNWVRKAHDEGRYAKPTHTNRQAGNPSADRRSSLARAIDDGLDWLGSGAQAGIS